MSTVSQSTKLASIRSFQHTCSYRHVTYHLFKSWVRRITALGSVAASSTDYAACALLGSVRCTIAAPGQLLCTRHDGDPARGGFAGVSKISRRAGSSLQMCDHITNIWFIYQTSTTIFHITSSVKTSWVCRRNKSWSTIVSGRLRRNKHCGQAWRQRSSRKSARWSFFMFFHVFF